MNEGFLVKFQESMSFLDLIEKIDKLTLDLSK